jgi:hypothetical protein
MSGLTIILSSAAKITHQAQALTGQTTKWHACCTIEPVPDEEVDPGSHPNSMMEEYYESESDCGSSEETEDEDMLENTRFMQPHTHVISFQKRQALGMIIDSYRLHFPLKFVQFSYSVLGDQTALACSDIPGEQQSWNHRFRVHAGQGVPSHDIHARVDALLVAAGEDNRFLINTGVFVYIVLLPRWFVGL